MFFPSHYLYLWVLLITKVKVIHKAFPTAAGNWGSDEQGGWNSPFYLVSNVCDRCQDAGRAEISQDLGYIKLIELYLVCNTMHFINTLKYSADKA